MKHVESAVASVDEIIEIRELSLIRAKKYHFDQCLSSKLMMSRKIGCRSKWLVSNKDDSKECQLMTFAKYPRIQFVDNDELSTDALYTIQVFTDCAASLQRREDAIGEDEFMWIEKKAL